MKSALGFAARRRAYRPPCALSNGPWRNFLLTLITGGTLGGWIGQLIVAVIGACLLIWLTRLVRGRT